MKVKTSLLLLGMVVLACNPSTWEVEAGGSRACPA